VEIALERLNDPPVLVQCESRELMCDCVCECLCECHDEPIKYSEGHHCVNESLFRENKKHQKNL